MVYSFYFIFYLKKHPPCFGWIYGIGMQVIPRLEPEPGYIFNLPRFFEDNLLRCT